MNIGTKLLLGFLAVALAVAGVGYYSITGLENASLQCLGGNLADQAALAMSQIDETVHDRIGELGWYASAFSLAEHAARSTEEFDSLPDAKAHIESIDADWKAGRTTPAIQEVLNNDLSKMLKAHLRYRNREAGYVVFPEVYATNKYGVVIGSTGRTSDYLQADEPWYQAAVAAGGGWVGDVKFDKSSQSHSIDVAVPLHDEHGRFVGLAKAVLGINDVARVVRFVQGCSCYKSATVYLVDQDGREVLGAKLDAPAGAEDVLALEASGEDLRARKPVVEAMTTDRGFLTFREAGTEKLAAFSRSSGYENFAGSGWSLIMEYDRREVLHNVLVAKRFLLFTSGIAAVVAILGGVVLSRSISTRINDLTAAASGIAAGKLDVRAKGSHAKDEIAVLARAFNYTAEQLTVFRRFAEASGQGFGMADLEGRITYLNPTLCRLLGEKKPEDAFGKSYLEYYPEEAWKTLEEEMKPAVLEQGGWSREMTLISRTGQRTPTIQNAFLIRDEKHNPLALAVVVTDITKRKKAEEALWREHRALEKLLESSDQELKLIAYEIHDGLAQMLTGTLMQCQAYHRLKGNNPEEAAKVCAANQSMVAQCLSEARRLISRVRLPLLDESGVVAALQNLVYEGNNEPGPEIQFHCRVKFKRLEPVIENAIYRIVQEGLANAQRHSGSEKVQVELIEQEAGVRIEVRDWGKGFDPETVKGKLYGLDGIRERARLLGGRAVVDSAPGEGTRVLVELPLAVTGAREPDDPG